MEKRHFKPRLMVFIALSGLLPVIGGILLNLFLSDWIWIREPLHSVVEALGSFAALSLAVVILLLRKDKRISSHYIWVSCALIGMGILDMFHAFTSPGDSFAWLHGTAVLVGGFLFAMVWLPGSIAKSRSASSLSVIVAIMAIILGVFSIGFSDTLPAMISQGAFTTAAKAINIFGGLFFLSAAVYFIKLYRSGRSLEDFLFANFCLLNGWAGLLFQFSQMWYVEWWFWHLLRLVAYFTVISYMFIIFQRAGKKLRQKEKELDQFFNLSLDMFCIAGLDGYFKRLNMAWEKTLGFTNDELQAKPFIEFVHPEDRETTIAEIQRLKAGATTVHFENRYMCKDGSFRWLAWASKPIAEENLIYAVARDVTERKHAEENISKLLEELRTIFDNIPVGIAYLDRDFKFLRVNKFMCSLTGINEEDLTGRLCYETVGEYVGFTRKGLEKICSFCKKDECFKTRRPTVIERPLGNSITKVITVPKLDKDGNISHFLEVIEDITERKRSEAALRESEERYRKLVEFSPDAIAIHSEGKIVFANLAGAKLLGAADPGQIIGKPLLDIVHPDYQDIVRERLRQMRDGGPDVPRIEEKIVRLDGSVIDVEVASTPFNHQGKHGMQVIVRDITERKRIEDELRKSEYSYRTLSENLPGVVYRVFLRENNRMQFFNNMVQPMTGFAIEELTSGDICSLDPLILSEDRAHVITAIKCAIADNRPFQVEYRLRRKEGGIRYFSERGRPIYGADGEPFYIDGVIFDITERKQAEEQILEQAALLDKAHDAIAVRDLEHRIIYWNKGAERLYGWTKEEATGKNANELLYKEESSSLVDARRSVIGRGEWTGELRQRTKSGKDIIIESRWTLVHDGEGKPKSILIINTDITEKKTLEAQLLRAQRLESIGTLASGIAHDINNVLLPMMLSLQLLRDRLKDDESLKLLNILERSAQRGASLIKQVQSFARGVEGERIALQVTHIISEIRQIITETFPRSIEIRTDIPRDLWIIIGDATQLHQVLMNLCVNARDAMPDGGILSISAENVLIDENYAKMSIHVKTGQYAVITVSDTGAGIPPEIMDRIFEPFFTTKEHGKGTGLGLSTALAIVKSHGGFINVYSEAGKGTVFKVYLPAVKAIARQKAEEPMGLPAGRGELILVIDDEANICEITRAILEKHGYRVLTASDGKEAIAIYTQNKERIKIVLIDMMMPIMEGPESIRELRKVNPKVKIIAISGLVERNRLSKVAVTHIHAFLAKPFTAERLLRTVHEVINTK